MRDYWTGMRPRARALTLSALTVLLLTGVMLTVSALSAPSRNDDAITELSESQRAELAVIKGLNALASGETTTAAALLEEALRLDPDNAAARDALEEIRRQASSSEEDERSPGDSPETGTDPADDSNPDPAPDDAEFMAPVEDLSVLLPSSVQGYGLGPPVLDPTDATVSGSPVDPELLSSRAQWTVHDRGTSAKASEFVASVSKSLYSLDASNLQIDGAPAYFGTDGTRFASIVYVRGRFVFEVVLTTIQEQPAALRSEAEAAATAFPDTSR